MPHQCTTCGHTFADGSKDMLGGCPDCGGNKFQFYPPGTEVPDEPPADADEAAPEPSPDPSGAASTVGRAATKVRDFVSKDPDPAADTVTARDDAGSVDADAGDPDPNAPWPDSSDAADPIRKGGFQEDGEDDTAESQIETEDGIIDADARATREGIDDAEDFAQSDARSGVATDAEVAAATEDAAKDAAADTAGESAADTAGDLEAAESTVDRDGPAGAPDDTDGRVVSEPTGEQPDLSELREQLNDQFESIKILEPGQYELNLMELYDREEYIIALQENGRYVIQVPENWMGDRPGE
ncbi:OapC/ArvC family zinc-ribbon domain-containing protein [Halorarius litoreus]|uniref:OapC/ArvC family zinc-ribbon domain-containing protein n=1 Tax=Halorarius litoreus TaxID=2962676 RepID=UPI0020CFD81F|nr:Zn-ribbon containing protein [Halorarius litoreus]